VGPVKTWLPLLAAIGFVAGLALAGGNGIGSGGLNGFPVGGGGSTSVFGFDGGVITADTVNITGTGGTVLNFTAQTARIVAAGGNYLINNGATGRWLATGGYGAPSYALGTSATAGNIMDSTTAPTISNGCTGEAVTWNNGSAAFRFDVGTSCTGVTSTVITLPTVANCWTCSCYDIAADATLQQAFAGCGTTSFTISNRTRATQAATDYVDGADIQCHCRGG